MLVLEYSIVSTNFKHSKIFGQHSKNVSRNHYLPYGVISPGVARRTSTWKVFSDPAGMMFSPLSIAETVSKVASTILGVTIVG